MDSISDLESFCFPFKKDILLEKLYITDIYSDEKFYQLKYLINYLKKLDCNSMLIEDKYKDKYYLDDFMHFYASCNTNYENYCMRIHFFKNEILESDFMQFSEEKHKIYQENYLGFMIIKPIHGKIIGRTIINTYSDTIKEYKDGLIPSKRIIIPLRIYKVNIFGNNFEIKSLPFQQQDGIISACSTCATWTILEKATFNFGLHTPTPYEIKTKAHSFYSPNRPFPSSGLEPGQVINSIRSFGMEVDVIDYESNIIDWDKQHEFLLSPFYAYLRGGIPIFLGIQISSEDLYEYHAIAVLGYELNEKQPELVQCPYVGNRISKIYVHDDNIGPFAKYKIIDLEEKKKKNVKRNQKMIQ